MARRRQKPAYLYDRHPEGNNSHVTITFPNHEMLCLFEAMTELVQQCMQSAVTGVIDNRKVEPRDLMLSLFDEHDFDTYMRVAKLVDDTNLVGTKVLAYPPYVVDVLKRETNLTLLASQITSVEGAVCGTLVPVGSPQLALRDVPGPRPGGEQHANRVITFLTDLVRAHETARKMMVLGQNLITKAKYARTVEMMFPELVNVLSRCPTCQRRETPTSGVQTGHVTEGMIKVAGLLRGYATKADLAHTLRRGYVAPLQVNIW